MKWKIKKDLLVVPVILLCILFVAFGFNVQAMDKSVKKQIIINNMNEKSGGKLKIQMSYNKGLQVFISGKLSDKRKANAEETIKYLDENKAVFDMDNLKENLKVKSITKDELGFTHIKFIQLLNGQPIENTNLIVHFNKDNIITGINGNLENRINTVTRLGNKNIDEKEAKSIALQQLKVENIKTELTVEKEIIIVDNNAYEVYKVNVVYHNPNVENWSLFVETSSGNIMDKINNIRQIGEATIGTGTAMDGSTKAINLYLENGNYEMIDTTKPMLGQIKTYSANNAYIEPGTLVSNTSNIFSEDIYRAAVNAHYNAGVVYDFYKNLFSRNSLDNNGINIVTTVHYGTNYNDAFWDGTEVVFGGGDSKKFIDLCGDLDIVAHELTHAVIQYTANLNYKDQSGALNESLSDIFGVLIETYYKYNVAQGGVWKFNQADWVVGDEVYTPTRAGDALRSLFNPKLYGQPDNMTGYVITSSDNGGVHTNSGILNKAAFLIAQTIGCEKTAKIYYRILTNYLTSSSDFLAARNSLIQAAIDIYGDGSDEKKAVESAFDSVNIEQLLNVSTNNNSISNAYTIEPNVIYSSTIAAVKENDYYKIILESNKAVNILLTNLPYDYDLYLYDSTGKLIKQSTKSGTQDENINFSVTNGGIYYIRVFSYGKSFSSTKMYWLTARD